MDSLKGICSGLPLNPLPPKQEKRDTSVPHAPNRTPNLSAQEEKVLIWIFSNFSLTILCIIIYLTNSQLLLKKIFLLLRSFPNCFCMLYPWCEKLSRFIFNGQYCPLTYFSFVNYPIIIIILIPISFILHSMTVLSSWLISSFVLIIVSLTPWIIKLESTAMVLFTSNFQISNWFCGGSKSCCERWFNNISFLNALFLYVSYYGSEKAS